MRAIRHILGLLTVGAALGFAPVPLTPGDRAAVKSSPFAARLPRVQRDELQGMGRRRRVGATMMAIDPSAAELAFGMVAGSVSSAMLLPIDLVKTWSQLGSARSASDNSDVSGVTNPSTGASGAPEPAGQCVGEYLKETLQRDGVGGLFKGLYPAVLGGAPEAGIQFATRDYVVTSLTAAWLSHWTASTVAVTPLLGTLLLSLGPGVADAGVGAGESGIAGAILLAGASTVGAAGSVPLPGPDEAQLLAASLALPAPPHVLINAVGGCTAGLLQVVATCPMDVLKQREMMGAEKKSPLELGAGGLFKGTGATWLRDVPFAGVYFASVASFQGLCHSVGMGEAESTVVAGLASGFLASFVTTPADVIKTKVQCSESGETIGGVFRRTLREEGVGGLFTGVVPRVSKMGPCMMINSCVYETLKALAGPML